MSIESRGTIPQWEINNLLDEEDRILALHGNDSEENRHEFIQRLNDVDALNLTPQAREHLRNVSIAFGKADPRQAAWLIKDAREQLANYGLPEDYILALEAFLILVTG
jgi:hypothetical protein